MTRELRYASGPLPMSAVFSPTVVRCFPCNSNLNTLVQRLSSEYAYTIERPHFSELVAWTDLCVEALLNKDPLTLLVPVSEQHSDYKALPGPDSLTLHEHFP